MINQGKNNFLVVSEAIIPRVILEYAVNCDELVENTRDKMTENVMKLAIKLGRFEFKENLDPESGNFEMKASVIIMSKNDYLNIISQIPEKEEPSNGHT